MPAITGAHHIAFTVRDADRSAQWYEDLLSMKVVLKEADFRFTPIAETPIGSVIVFRDSDNIQWEFWPSAGQ